MPDLRRGLKDPRTSVFISSQSGRAYVRANQHVRPNGIAVVSRERYVENREHREWPWLDHDREEHESHASLCYREGADKPEHRIAATGLALLAEVVDETSL